MSLTNPIPRGTREVTVTTAPGQTSFGPLDFLLFDAADLALWSKSPGADYFSAIDPADFTVTPAAPAMAWPAFPQVTLDTALAEGSSLRLRGVRVPARATDVTRDGKLQSQSLERELDKQVATEQELRRDIDRSSANADLVENIAAQVAGVGDAVHADRVLTENARDQTLLALSSAAVPLESRAFAQDTYRPVIAPDYFQTFGYGAAGDSGEALYIENGTTAGDAVLTEAGGAIKGFNIIAAELNPYQFGAKGDGDGSGGGTNDAVALQLAMTIAAARKRPLLFRGRGIYRSNSGFVVPAGLEIDLGEANLDFKAAVAAAGLQYTDGGALWGRGGALLGPGNAVMAANSAGVKCFGTFNSGAAPTFVKAPIVEGVEIANFAGYGVNFGYAQDGRVRNCKLHDLGYAGVGGVSCNRVHVLENHIKDITSTGTSNWYGAFIDRKDGVSVVSDPRSYDCDFIGNLVENITWEGLDTHGGVRFKFKGNTLRNVGRGIAIVPSQITGGNPIAPQEIVVESNIFENAASTKEHITIAGAYSGGVTYEFARGITVQGNVLHGGGNQTDPDLGAIYAYSTQGLNINGNRLYRSMLNGVCLGFSNIGFNVSGNTYRDPYSNSGPCACVRSRATDNRGYIGGETFEYSELLSTYTAEYSVFVESASGTDITVGRNAYVGIASGRLEIIGSGLTGCDISSAWSASGGASLGIVNGTGFTTVAVTFNRRAPRTGGTVVVAMDSSYTGNKPPIFRVNNVTQTGFTVTAYPAAGGNFDGSGTIDIRYRASL